MLNSYQPIVKLQQCQKALTGGPVDHFRTKNMTNNQTNTCHIIMCIHSQEGTFSCCEYEPWSVTLTLHRVKVNQHAKYVGQRSFGSIIIVQAHRHTQCTDCSTSVPGPPKWSVITTIRSWHRESCNNFKEASGLNLTTRFTTHTTNCMLRLHKKLLLKQIVDPMRWRLTFTGYHHSSTFQQ